MTSLLLPMYTVLMSKQIVRHSEQQGMLPANGTNGSASATPMVERAFLLLDLLGASERGMTLSDLARALDMSKGSLHGLLRTLEASGAVEQDSEKLYSLGPRVFDLAQRYIQGAGLRRFALPAMQRLAATSDETVLLGRVESNGVRILEIAQTENEHAGLRITARQGSKVHMLAGATARVILASWPPEQREAYLSEHALPRFTDHSVTDKARFLREVEQVAYQGIGMDYGEYLTGVNAVATPIQGPGNTLIALLWIVGFASRFGVERMTILSEHLHTEAQNISRSLLHI
ncbi:IclR family transcriptional regulator [Ktedonospora formicarum]|uniref:Glycerol operon regulatory protein n=1 Tax=Ktedonospora formicarum TaxID=2778364 RepID=A0A8J3MUA2_9CHLR|nr:IclR family transcriptional regulator [Ktedonospora formicarum]GHO46721.1 IclR family transcriptional regulator [Ktedonospora formicarum]